MFNQMMDGNHNTFTKISKFSKCEIPNSVISMYSQSRRVEQARKAFDLLSKKNLVSYNALLDGYARNLDPNAAFELFINLKTLRGRQTRLPSLVY